MITIEKHRARMTGMLWFMLTTDNDGIQISNTPFYDDYNIALSAAEQLDSKGDMKDNFYPLIFDADDHHVDAARALFDGQLVPICDDTEGGIIAYAIGQKHADKIVSALLENKEDMNGAQ
jgi:hypothetical protein